MEIRTARDSDAKEISEIPPSLSQPFFIVPDGKGANVFLESISETAVTSYITGENFAYYVGVETGKIVGVAAIRDNSHLYHLFVLASCQRRQMGKQLWEHAKEKAMILGNQSGFTVNSSMNAVPVYKSFGFEQTSEMRQVDGVSFVPMALAYK